MNRRTVTTIRGVTAVVDDPRRRRAAMTGGDVGSSGRVIALPASTDWSGD